MNKFLIIFTILSIFSYGCCCNRKVQQIPVQTIEKIEYRDSVIYCRDTVYFPLPSEDKETSTQRDSSHLETSIANSDAWIDNDGKLNHRLRNKNKTLKTTRDTVFIVKYKTEYKEKEVPVEVPVEVPYIPKFAWLCIIFTCSWAVLKIAKLIWKFKGLK